MTNLDQRIDASLRGIFASLDELNYPTFQRRRKGIAGQYVRDRLSELQLSMPGGLIEMYAFSDGTENLEGATLGDIYLFPGFHWMNFSEVEKCHADLVKQGDWPSHWLPLFADGGGDFYVVLCDGASPDFGKVALIVRGEEDQYVEYESIAAFLAVQERCYKTGIYFMQNGYMESNDDARLSAAEAIQPSFSPHLLK